MEDEPTWRPYSRFRPRESRSPHAIPVCPVEDVVALCRRLIKIEMAEIGYDASAFGHRLEAGIDRLLLLHLVGLDLMHERDVVFLDNEDAGIDGLLHQGIAATGATDERAPSALFVRFRCSARPGVGHRDIRRLARGIGADPAAKLEGPALGPVPEIEIVLVEDPAIAINRPGGTRISVTAVAKEREVLLTPGASGKSHAFQHLPRTVEVRKGAAGKRQCRTDQFADPGVVPGVIVDAGDVAGLADDGKGAALIEEFREAVERRHRTVAGSCCRQHVIACPRDMAAGTHGTVLVGPDVTDEVDRATLEEVDGKGRQRSTR